MNWRDAKQGGQPDVPTDARGRGLSSRAERGILLIPAIVLLLMAGAARGSWPGSIPGVVVPVAAASAPATARRVLRVCADPNNLPFSNDREQGFENRIATVIARELGADLEYTWWAQRRGFIRNTLRAGLCDLVPGVPTSFELVLATRPYYRSTYVFLYRKDAPSRSGRSTIRCSAGFASGCTTSETITPTLPRPRPWGTAES